MLAGQAQAIALSVLRGQAYSLRDDDLQLLASVEATGWTDADAWDEARVAQLVERGLLVSDAETARRAEKLRRRAELQPPRRAVQTHGLRRTPSGAGGASAKRP